MLKTEYAVLVAEYGEEKARKALEWFVTHHSSAFRASVEAAAYCRDNEYLWF